MSDSYKEYISPIIRIVAVFLLGCSALMSSLSWSEVATATDDNTDAVVVGKIIQDQQQTSQNQTASKENTETTVQSPQIANDMAKGESIRGLPTLNAPVVDQANLLTESQKQEISQRILALHEQG